MDRFLTKCRFAVLAVTVLFAWGCADLAGRLDQLEKKLTTMGSVKLPEPIATSLDQMPEDAAKVAAAIQKRMIGARQEQVQKVRFDDDAGLEITQPWSTGEDFFPSGAQLYLHQPTADDPSEKTTSGRLDFEGPLGRRASVRYDARYRPSEQGLIIRETRVTPIYSYFPEPIMFVVPAQAFLTPYPDRYGELFEYVGERAVNYAQPESVLAEKKEYAILVFFLDRISPASKLEVKVSDDPQGIYGYKDSTKYIDFNGWRVALLPGHFTLFDNGGEPDLFVKAVFTPGKEVGFIRPPKVVGLFCINEASPGS
jgi:hypothetical protein